MKGNDEDLRRLAEAVKQLFEEGRGEFLSRDFMAVADLLGFHAREKGVAENQLKPVAENYLPDIISTNLRYAVETYQWTTHIPTTEDGIMVSGFWDRSKPGELPKGYELEDGGKFLRRKT
jgi:hypothetical protein